MKQQTVILLLSFFWATLLQSVNSDELIDSLVRFFQNTPCSTNALAARHFPTLIATFPRSEPLELPFVQETGQGCIFSRLPSAHEFQELPAWALELLWTACKLDYISPPRPRTGGPIDHEQFLNLILGNFNQSKRKSEQFDNFYLAVGQFDEETESEAVAPTPQVPANVTDHQDAILRGAGPRKL